MSKRSGSKFKPGIIYDLGWLDEHTGLRTPFYVGETQDPKQRLDAHRSHAQRADSTSTIVYQTIQEFDRQGIKWTMNTLCEYGEEGPGDLEDEWIMNHLYSGYTLTNMKKGSTQWLEQREQAAKDMRRRGIPSYRKYREVITKERVHQSDLDAIDWGSSVNPDIVKMLLPKSSKLSGEERRKRDEIEQKAKLIWADRAEQYRAWAEETERQRADINFAECKSQRDRLDLQRQEDRTVTWLLEKGSPEEQIRSHIQRERRLLWLKNR